VLDRLAHVPGKHVFEKGFFIVLKDRRNDGGIIG
jgi:hypothetical protein